MKEQNKICCPEMTDREVIEMLAKIFGVGVNVANRESEEERA